MSIKVNLDRPQEPVLGPEETGAAGTQKNDVGERGTSGDELQKIHRDWKMFVSGAEGNAWKPQVDHPEELAQNQAMSETSSVCRMNRAGQEVFPGVFLEGVLVKGADGKLHSGQAIRMETIPVKGPTGDVIGCQQGFERALVAFPVA